MNEQPGIIDKAHQAGCPDEERWALSEFLFTVYDHGTQPNAVREADAILEFLRSRRTAPASGVSREDPVEQATRIIGSVYGNPGPRGEDPGTVAQVLMNQFEEAVPTREDARAIVEDAMEAYLEAYPGDDHRKRFAALDRLAAGFHRTVQGEPTFTEAQVEAACVAFYEHASGLTSWSRLVEYDAVLAERYRDGIGRALRAAAAVQGGGTR